MNIFKQELLDNLGENIKAQSCVAYSSAIQPVDVGIKKLSKAALEDSEHLYRFYSILVSTCVNANDDVFGPQEVWNARSSPTHKPVNLNHEEKEIVGHITDVWAVDTEYKEVEAPQDFYHLLIGQCIYKKWSDGETQEKFNELIEKIESGKLYVSMECYFKNIAYFITAPDKKNYILARNEDTSFLTKHLRAYGGKGLYNDYKVDRYLLDLSFSAVGIVENPANKYSIIFPANSEYNFGKAEKINHFDNILNKQGVYSSSSKHREKIMADVDNKELELKAALDAANKKISELESQHAKVAQEKHVAEVAELNSELEAAKKDKEEMKKHREEMEKEKDKMYAEKTALDAKVQELDKQNKEYAEKFAKIEAEQLKAKRIAKLLEANVDKNKVEEYVETFADLSDKQFDIVAASLAVKTDETVDLADKNADASVLDKAEPEKDVNLSVSDKEDKTEKTESLRKAFANLLQYGKNSKVKK